MQFFTEYGTIEIRVQMLLFESRGKTNLVKMKARKGTAGPSIAMNFGASIFGN